MLNRITFKNKLLFTFLIYGCLLSVFTLIIIYTLSSYNIQHYSIDKAQLKAEEKIQTLHTHISDIQDILFAVNNSQTFKKFLNRKESYTNTQELFLNIASTSKNIMQLRYINKNGKEVIRIDRKNSSSLPQAIKKKQLQDKHKRYYFNSIMQLEKNQVWHSKIDLNIENGKIQEPFEAVFRVGIPVFNQQQKQGLLIVNIFMNDFLKSFVNSSSYHIYLIDKNGYFKAHRNIKKIWSQYKNYEYTLKDEFPEHYTEILFSKEYMGKYLYSKSIDLYDCQENTIVVQPTYFTIKEEISALTYQLLFIMAGLILFSFPLAVLFAKTPTKLKEEVDELNKSLEKRVHEKTYALIELNRTLEQKVQEEVSKNTKKDKLLYQQSKIAALGDMLGNIAHQWRQPLSVISSAASGMKVQKELNLLDDKNFHSVLDLILKNSEYLSQTIDDFRNFFKPNKAMVRFNLSLSIQEDLNILSSTLRNNHITVIANLEKEVYITGLKNELTQVHLNIISNAKDILLSVENKYLTDKLIFVELTTTLKEAIITIKDNGGGISEAILDRIFEPYFTTKHKSKGTGIGLFMSEEIISKHLKGSIEVANTIYRHEDNLYKGAIFTIKLPME
jgi:signal transduction histidine kinase